MAWIFWVKLDLIIFDVKNKNVIFDTLPKNQLYISHQLFTRMTLFENYCCTLGKESCETLIFHSRMLSIWASRTYSDLHCKQRGYMVCFFEVMNEQIIHDPKIHVMGHFLYLSVFFSFDDIIQDRPLFSSIVFHNVFIYFRPFSIYERALEPICLFLRLVYFIHYILLCFTFWKAGRCLIWVGV